MVARPPWVLLALTAGCTLTDVDADGYPAPEDCADHRAAVHPGAEEDCDGRDQDCDGEVDETPEGAVWYVDADGDGWGGADHWVPTCDPALDLVLAAGDCDDLDPERSPGASEWSCDGIDQDCDGRDGECMDLGDAAVLRSVAAAEYTGYSVAGLGDVDGDRYADVLVGAPNWSLQGSREGAVWLVRGGPGLRGTDLAASATLLPGVTPRARAGTAVGRAGDANGDGFQDMLVGAPEDSSGGRLVGLAYLVLGGWDFALADLSEADAIFIGDSTPGRAGAALSGGGDVDGDGLDDLLIGAPYARSAAGYPGAAYLVLGTASPQGGNLKEAGDCLLGWQDQSSAGYAVAVAGDVDGDGLADLLVGAPGASLLPRVYGAVFLVRGGHVSGDRSLADADAAFFGPGSSGAGRAVAGAGDVDGDGLCDLLLGACLEWTDGVATGAAHLVLGAPRLQGRSLAEADVTFHGREGDLAGASVAGAGDVDRDGFADLLVGSSNAWGGEEGSGAVDLLLGGPSLAGGSFDLSDRHFAGEHQGDLAGASVAGVGDVDGDGLGDLLVGAPCASMVTGQNGAAYLLFGSDLW